MDSHDSSSAPSHHHLNHLQPPPNSYPLQNTNNSATNAAVMHQHQNPRFPFNSAPAPNPLDHHYPDGSSTGGGGFSMEPSKKKRGRPRKYSPDNSIGLGLSPAPANQISPVVARTESSGGGGTQSSETAAKRHRGRPPGSGKKQLNALGSPGVGFTPHVLKVSEGEDIASKIMAFSQQGPRTVCILSANGAVSNVTLHQSAISGGTITYEGRFEIISLSGSLMPSENNGGNRSRSGGLSVSLAGSDGRVLGGGVAGMLKAASAVQVVVGSFSADGKKPKSGGLPSPSPVPPPSNMLNFGVPMAAVDPPSPGDSSESDDQENDDSPINNHASGGHFANNANMSVYQTMGWPNSIKRHPN